VNKLGLEEDHQNRDDIKDIRCMGLLLPSRPWTVAVRYAECSNIMVLRLYTFTLSGRWRFCNCSRICTHSKNCLTWLLRQFITYSTLYYT